MNNRYKVKEIIAAVDLLLGTKESKLKLVNEIKYSLLDSGITNKLSNALLIYFSVKVLVSE